MNKTLAKKYLSTIKAIKKKNITSVDLSKKIGFYPDKINEDLSTFEPLIAMYSNYNVKELIPNIEQYIEEQEKSGKKIVRFEAKKKASKYKSVADFVYQKMTVGGLVDRSASLSVEDLKVLRKLVSEEIDELKGK